MSILHKIISILLFPAIIFSLNACSAFISSQTSQFADNLQASIENHDDPDTVLAAVPAYLIMLDTMIAGNQSDEELFVAGADLYSAYAGFTDDPKRKSKLASKSLDYAIKAACIRRERACNATQLKYDEFSQLLTELNDEDVATFYTLGTSWASWIEANTGDWNAVAQLAQLKALMLRILELKPAVYDGGPHLYLGVMESLVPPGMGGKPELAQKHFQKAIELSGGQNLMAKVAYARFYARLMFDRELHDRLLQEVEKADPQIPGYVLINTIAQQQAQELLRSADDYF